MPPRIRTSHGVPSGVGDDPLGIGLGLWGLRRPGHRALPEAEEGANLLSGCAKGVGGDVEQVEGLLLLLLLLLL